MKKLLVLLLVIFTLTGCFCSEEKEKIKKAEQTAKKEMIDYLTKNYGITDVREVSAANSEGRYLSCPSFSGNVIAYFDYQGKQYGILYRNGVIKDELSYERIVTPILVQYVNNNLFKSSLPNIKNVVLEDNDYYYKGKTLLNIDEDMNSIEKIINKTEISSIRIQYNSNTKFLENNKTYYENLYNKIKNDFNTYYDSKDYIGLIVESYSNDKLTEKLIINKEGSFYESY